MKFIKLVLGDAFNDIGMGDMDLEKLDRMGVQEEILSVDNEQSSDEDEQESPNKGGNF